MKTFTNCAEKKAKQFLNLLQGYTKGIRMTAILVLLLMGVSNAWAVNITGGTTLYLKPNTDWKKDGARFAAYFCNGSSEAEWYSMSDCNGDGIFEVTVSGEKSHTNVIFCRMNGNNQTNDWNNKWNQTNDLTWDGTKNLCTITGWDKSSSWSSRSVTWYLTGDMNSWNTSSNQLSGSPLTQTITLSAEKTYEFKIYNSDKCYFGNTGTMERDNHSNWTMTHGETNCKITTDLQGNYKFAFDEATKKLTVTYPEECFLKGDFNDWSNTHSILGGSVTINLKAGTYEFKIHRYDATSAYWVSNDGTMSRENCSDWTMYDDVDKNCKITADFDGDYTFTYDRSTGKLSVTYPTAYKVTYGVGTNKGTASVTTSPNITSGSLALPSTSITFRKGAIKEGYTWKGWYSKTDGTGTKWGDGTTYTSTNRTGDISVYACYDLITYNITYNLNGGTGVSNSTYNIESSDITLLTPTKDHYDFAGWYDNESLTGTAVTKISKGSIGDKTFYAKWTPKEYSITYNNVDGVSHSNPATYTIESETITFTAPTSERTGYTFAAWEPASIAQGSTGDKTIQATWTANTYTVVFNKNANDATGSMSNQAFTYDVAQNLTANAFERTGYTFNRWYKNTDGTGTSYTNAQSVNNLTAEDGATVTLYAQWTPINYTITYKDQGGGNFSGTHASGHPTTHTYGTATTLKTATKTGYDFGGWHTDQACTQKVTSLGATAYTAAITLYAKWTINQYTLTYSAGEGGSVTGPHESGAKYDYNTSITLTATPTTGNIFVQWVNESGTMVSTANPYTFNITKNSTLKAEFAPPTTVYLKPVDWWPNDGARFAIYTWGAGKTNRWVEMQHVDCENQYYSANIPTGYSDFKYVRLDPKGEGDASKNDGLHWEYKWGETGDLTLQGEDKNLYTTPRIYLKPNANWKADGARFAAYFFKKDGETTHEYWMSMYKDGDYYYCNIPTNNPSYDQVIFCRMDPSEAEDKWDNKWDQTNDLELPTTGDNLYTVAEGAWSNGSGSWSTHWETFTTPTYDVTIKPTIHGTYSVECNGRTYPVTYKEDIVIPDVPVGTVLTIQDVKPNKETEYTSDIIYKESANATYQTVTDNQIIVCGNTTIDENFVTKKPHVVYLRIPDNLDWETDEHQYLYAYDKLEDETVELTAAPNASNYEPGYTYYTCTIPAGTHTIRFEYINGSTKYQTHDFPHVMPLGSLNCYTIQAFESAKVFNGYWSELLSIGDYRLLYVEQVVEKDKNNKTVITRKKAHPSNIIKKRTETGTDTVSLHVYNQNRYNATYKWENEETPLTYETSSNSAVILQQYDGSKWVDLDNQHHMIFGPLEAHQYTAMLPGRRNATAEDKPLVAQLKADYGIKAIINDTHEDKGNGVWNFPIQQTVNGGNTTVELMRENVHRYEGEYYIRTDVANGGWFNYNPTNHMTRSDEAKANSNFSHYYCKWVGEAGVNVKFTVANDYGYAISDTLEADRTDLWGVALANKMVGDDQTLPEQANVRFAWNEYSNFVHRAYIAGSTDVKDRFLVLEGDANIFDATGSALNVSDLNANEQIFRDNSNWIYYADVQMKPMAPVKVTAQYNDKIQYFIGKQDQTVTLLQGTGEEKYLIRMLYDFKTNQLISAYVPGASPDVHAISTNLMLIRQNNNEATQLIFNNETPRDMEPIPTDRRAYGVIEFTKERLIDDTELNEYARSLYWISFPFKVDVSKAICFGEYGKHWIIQEYNGERRAKEGMWLDSETFWDYKWDQNITLKAGKGYVLALDVDQIASDGLFGLAGNRPIGIYFPSTEYINTEITQQANVSTTVPAHVCTINRNTPKGDRRIADSHWNVIGVPSYVNAMGDYNYAEFTELAEIETKPKEVKYYYRWDGDFNAYTAMETTNTQDFQSTFAYMVQFAGQINWKNIFNVSGAPQALAAKQSTDSEQEHRLRLELHQKGNKADHTFVRLQDEDGVTNRFDFNHDLCKVINAGANIYSVITAEESPVEVAANVMPITETIIPVGVKITAAGEYTFAMPEGTDGIVVELIDYENNTRTNMLLDNYTVNLEKGTFDNRFALHVKPNKTTTSLEDINTNSNGVKKYLIDGILYMQKDGVLYDAQGRKL